MGLFEILMIGIGLSMDAFAAAVCKGLNMRKVTTKNVLIIGLFFGGFQAYIVSIDHWVAFILLAFIGGKMIYDVLNGEEGECCNQEDVLKIKEVFTLAVATSIDALAVGISFAFLRVNIIEAISLIGITTFVLASIGVMIGKKFGNKYKDKATLAGGIILILIGLKILGEHLGSI